MIKSIDEFYETKESWIEWFKNHVSEKLDDDDNFNYSIDVYIENMLDHNFDDDKIKAVLCFPNHEILYNAYLYGFTDSKISILTDEKYDRKQQDTIFEMLLMNMPDDIFYAISKPKYNYVKMQALTYVYKKRIPKSAMLYMAEKLSYEFQIYGLADRILSGIKDPEIILYGINEQKPWTWKFKAITEGILHKLDIESLKMINDAKTVKEAHEIGEILSEYKRKQVEEFLKNGMDLRAIYTSMKFGTNPYIQKACYMHKPEPVIRVLADAIRNGVPYKILDKFILKDNIVKDLSEEQLRFLVRQAPKEVNTIIHQFEKEIKETTNAEEKVNALRMGALYNLTDEQLAKCANTGYDETQIEQLVLGYGHGLTKNQIAMYDDPLLTGSAMEQMRLAIEHSLDDKTLNTLKEISMQHSNCERQRKEQWRAPVPDAACAREWFEAGNPDIFRGNYKYIQYGILEPLSKLNIEENKLYYIYSQGDQENIYEYVNAIKANIPFEAIQYMSKYNGDAKHDYMKAIIEIYTELRNRDFKKLLNPQLNASQIRALKDALLSGITEKQFDFINDPKLKASIMKCIKTGFICGYSEEHLEFFKIFNQILNEHVPDLDADHEYTLIGNSVRDFIFHVFDGKYEPEVLTAYITDFIKTDNKDKFLQGYDYLSGDIILEKYNKYVKSSNTVVEKSVLDKIKNETRAKSTGKKCDKSAEDWSPLYF